MLSSRLDNRLPDMFFQKPFLIQVLTFTFGGIYVHFDHSVRGVKVPPEHENADFYLDFCQQNVQIDPDFGMKIAIFSNKDNGESDAVVYEVPWDAIYILRYGDEFLTIWVEDMPQPVRAVLSNKGMIDLPAEPDEKDPFVLLSEKVEIAMRYAKATMTAFSEKGVELGFGSIIPVHESEDGRSKRKISFSVIPGDRKRTGQPSEKPNLRLIRALDEEGNEITSAGEEIEDE